MTLTPSAFGYVGDLVYRESAIVVGTGKEYLVESRLRPLARAAGLDSVDEYVSQVRTRGSAADRVAIVEALTTNETSWFRDRAPFDALVEHVVPELIRRGGARRKVTVWSAACSSGQEAYTIAMLLAEHLLPRGWSAEIVATDISSDMLERTREGRYSQLEVSRGLPAPMLVKHLHRDGTGWRVSEQLRSMVRVRHLNLAVPFPPLPVFDVVFMRNVLIYFDAATKRSVLARTRRAMAPDGFMFLGGAETTLGIDEQWARVPVGRCTIHQPQPGGRDVDSRGPSVPAAPVAGVR